MFDNDDEEKTKFDADRSHKTVKVTKTVTIQAGSRLSASIRSIIKVESNPNGTVTYTYEKEEEKPCNMCNPKKDGPYETCADVPQKC